MKESENNLYIFKTPEENLVYALIEDAKENLINKGEKWKDDYVWLMSDGEELPDSVSFVDCCNVLKWDCKKTRKYYIGLIEEGWKT